MVNSLVIHNKFGAFGVGCISKVLSKHYIVSFGHSDVKKCLKESVTVLDTSYCKTIDYDTFKRRILSDKSELRDCIVGNLLYHYVGIGWTSLRPITFEDLKVYPRVV